MARVILLNGPPGSGKDMLADFLCGCLNGTVKREFKTSLNALTVEYFGITPERWSTLVQREHKETPTPELQGYSPRQALIHVAEDVCKVRYGRDIFAKELAKTLVAEQNPVAIVSDCGFVDEVNQLVAQLGADRVMLVRLSRDGHTFAGDSRSYVHDDRCYQFDFHNKGSPDEVGLFFLSLVLRWLQG
jgi:hypothetical protein